MRSFNILFTSAGRRVSLVLLFREALRSLGLSGELVTADMKKTAPSSFVADHRELVPRASDVGYVDRIKEICKSRGISLVVPLIDPELIVLAPHRDDFASLGATLLVSSPQVNEICSSKHKTFTFFKSHGIPTPEVLDPVLVLADPHARYPLLLKPVSGSASIGMTKIANPRELEFFASYIEDPLLQEFVPGDEYTLDVLADFTGRVRCVVPRQRIETRAGEVSKGMTVKDRSIIAAGRRVVEALPGPLGCLNVQCILSSSGEIKFIEINPRFGGGFPLSARAGADFPRWIIEMTLGRPPEISPDGWEDNLVMLRYDESIFVRRGAVA